MSGVFTILGGTGFLGRRVVRRLLSEGERVRVAARHPERVPELLRSARAEPVEADLLDEESLAAALAGAQGVLNATSIYVETGATGFDVIHVEGAARLAKVARREGVGRLVQMSGVGASADARDPYIRARGRGELAVREAFPEAVIVRPSAMVGPDDALFSAIRATARALPLYPLFGDGSTRLQPAHVEDVAQAIATLLRMDDPASCYEFGGAKVYTWRELVLSVGDAAGATVRPIPVPFFVWRGLAAVAERLPGAPLTRSQVALAETDNVPAPHLPGLRDLGVAPREILTEA